MSLSFGFDFGGRFSPSTANSFGNGSTSSPYQTGTCAVESANCANVTGGADASRPYNRLSVGVRVTGPFLWPDVALSASTPTLRGKPLPLPGFPRWYQAGSGATPLTASGNQLKYDGQSFYQLGAALGFQGIAVNANFVDGRFNPGNNGLTPTGGASTVGTLIGVGYSNGPWVTGTNIAFLDWQGAAQYTHLSQRHEFALTYMVGYKLAPGINLAAGICIISKAPGWLALPQRCKHHDHARWKRHPRSGSDARDHPQLVRVVPVRA